MIMQKMMQKRTIIKSASTAPRIAGRNHSGRGVAGLVGPVSLTVGLFASYRELKNFTKVELSKSSIIPTYIQYTKQKFHSTVFYIHL